MNVALPGLVAVVVLAGTPLAAEEQWVTYEGGEGPGRGRHVVLVSGDEEYRSEEALPMLGRILAVRHGFQCTVLFAVNPETGEIDPGNRSNIPGLHLLAGADMLVIATRFRELPDEQMKFIVDFVNSGKPILGLRTATHAFSYDQNKDSHYVRFDWRSKDWPGGFGKQVLGETWVAHHGAHGKESTHGVVNRELADHPILKGVEEIWGPTDVYTVGRLPDDAKVLVHGQVLAGMKPSDPPNDSKPLMPLVWTRTFTGEKGQPARVIATTMGASVDLENEGLRRLLVNAVYWGLGMEDRIPARADVACVGEYQPTDFGFGTFQKGVKPSDHRIVR
ncbi:MAG TPA: ThuA domain-containing protein [Planctomycetaceae bacterium]|nr:ThuA domain-containing protein [Planctomycetaceae bacterium]